MQKKLVSLVVAGALGVSSLAAANTQEPDFYVGAQAGHMDTSLKYSEGGYTEDGMALTGFTGGVFAGFTFDFSDEFFLGMEANLQFGGADYKVSFSPVSEKYEADNGWGVGVLSGVKVSPSTKIYARVGYHETKFKATYREIGLSESDKETFKGVRFGGGGETALTDQLALRLEWTQTRYSSEGWFKPTENLVQVGLKISF